MHTIVVGNSPDTARSIKPAQEWYSSDGYFDTEARAFVDWLRQSPPADASGSVQIAGEPERAMRLRREQDGIEGDLQTWQEIAEAAGKVGVTI